MHYIRGATVPFAPLVPLLYHHKYVHNYILGPILSAIITYYLPLKEQEWVHFPNPFWRYVVCLCLHHIIAFFHPPARRPSVNAPQQVSPLDLNCFVPRIKFPWIYWSCWRSESKCKVDWRGLKHNLRRQSDQMLLKSSGIIQRSTAIRPP